jgi:hypothetical protein
MAVLAVVVAVAGVAFIAAAVADAGAVVLGVTLLAVALSLVAFVSVNVEVGHDGLRASSGTLPWPRVHVALADIDRVEAFDLRPMSWGGWGYRGSVRLFRRAAWVVRRGPALKLTLRNGRVFAVTVDGAGEAAVVLTRLLSSTPP